MSQIMDDACLKTELNVKTLIFRAVQAKGLHDPAIVAQHLYERYQRDDFLTDYTIDYLLNILTERVKVVQVH